jgi:ribosomal protein S18 acetylase RimI-like enzyme
MVGVVELMAGFPGATDWYVGLLMLTPEARGAGLGSSVFREVVGRVAEAGGRTLHLIVREDNPRAVAFWERHGFTLVDHRVQDLGTKVNRVLKMVRPL